MPHSKNSQVRPDGNNAGGSECSTKVIHAKKFQLASGETHCRLCLHVNPSLDAPLIPEQNMRLLPAAQIVEAALEYKSERLATGLYLVKAKDGNVVNIQ